MSVYAIYKTQKWINTASGQPFEAPEDCGKANAEVAKLAVKAMPRDGQEHLYVLAMDTKGHPLACSIVATGTVDSCPIYPRDIFSWALTVPRVRFVGIAHNHPSGTVTPSPQDSTASLMVAKAGALLPIDMLWSIVVTHESDEWAEVPMPQDRKRKPQPNDDDSEGKPEDEDEQGNPEPQGEPQDDKQSEPEPDGDGSDDDDDGDEPIPGDDDAPEEPDAEPDQDAKADKDAAPAETGSATIDELKASVRKAFKIGGK